MKISVVELATVAPGTDKTHALNEAVDAAQHTENAGYHRIWYSEHHDTGGFASYAPEILIALAARTTRRIRVGSGAVLLNHYSPFKVAETFLELEALAPGRIDLGLGRATAGPIVDLALRQDRNSQPVDDFRQKVLEVCAHLNRDFPAEHLFSNPDPGSGIASRPEVWILGSSGSSSLMAAELGLGYAFATFIDPGQAAPALIRHRASFKPSPHTSNVGHPAILSVSAVVADTDAEARRLSWSRTALLARLARTGTAASLPSAEEAARELSQHEKDIPCIVTDGRWPRQISGSPATIADQIAQMVDATGVDEIMVQDMIADPAARAHSRSLFAQALGVRSEVVV